MIFAAIGACLGSAHVSYAQTPTNLKMVQNHLKATKANDVQGAVSILADNIIVVSKADQPDGKPMTRKLYAYTLTAQGMAYGKLKSFSCVSQTLEQIDCDLKFERIAQLMKRSFELNDGVITKISHGKIGGIR